MGVPSPRTPVRVARGTYSVLNTNKASLEEGEVCYATDENRIYIKEGGNIEPTTAAADATKASLSGATFTGHVVLDNAKEVRLSETDANGSHYLGVKAPDSVTADKTFTLPDGHGGSGQVLTCSDASGTLGWTTPTVYQAADADLTAIAGLTSAADKGIQFTGSGTAGTYDLTSFAKTVLDDADAGAVRTTIGTGTGNGDVTLSGAQSFTGIKTFNAAARAEVTTLTSSSNATAVDLSLSNDFKLTLGENSTLSAPTNAVAGQSGVIWVTQDGTGSRTLAYHADWDFAAATAPVLTTTGNATDALCYSVYADSDAGVHVLITAVLDVS